MTKEYFEKAYREFSNEDLLLLIDITNSLESSLECVLHENNIRLRVYNYIESLFYITLIHKSICPEEFKLMSHKMSGTTHLKDTFDYLASPEITSLLTNIIMKTNGCNNTTVASLNALLGLGKNTLMFNFDIVYNSFPEYIFTLDFKLLKTVIIDFINGLHNGKLNETIMLSPIKTTPSKFYEDVVIPRYEIIANDSFLLTDDQRTILASDIMLSDKYRWESYILSDSLYSFVNRKAEGSALDNMVKEKRIQELSNEIFYKIKEYYRAGGSIIDMSDIVERAYEQQNKD